MSLHDLKSAPPSIQRLAADIQSWFRLIDVPHGEPENSFALDGKWLGRNDALELVSESHKRWKSMSEQIFMTETNNSKEFVVGEAAAISRQMYSGPWVNIQAMDSNNKQSIKHTNQVEASLAYVRLGNTIASKK